MVAYCLFEQSGVFKNAFKDLGIKAFDFDIKNDFKQTDTIVDLFNSIELAYNNEPSFVFDLINPKDSLLFAFFPCIRFSHQMQLNFTGNCGISKYKDDYTKIIRDIKYHNELNFLYNMFCKFYIICLNRGFKCIIENPYNTEHYLTKYFAIKPDIIDYDRRLDGDLYKKPTQYWFINFKPKNNFLFEPIPIIDKHKTIMDTSNRVERSLISPYYANRFIRKYILPGGTNE